MRFVQFLFFRHALAQWMLKPFRKAALKMLGDIINISQKIFICCQRVTLTKSISSDNESD